MIERTQGDRRSDGRARGALRLAAPLAAVLAAGAIAGCNEVNVCGPSGPVPGVTCAAYMTTSFSETRDFWIHVPAGYDGATPVPLVLNLTGLGQPTNLYEWGTGMSAKADAVGFIVVYPNAATQWRTGAGADSAPDRAFLNEVVDYVEAGWNVDAARIFATGVSSGGGMVYRLACDHADRFAAFAPVVAAYSHEGDPCQPSRIVPMYFTFGEQDTAVPWPDGKQVLEAPPRLAQDWAALNGTTGFDQVLGPVMDVWTWTHPTSPDGDVTLVLGHSMSHQWPTQNANGFQATDILWDFFVAHPLP